MAVLPNKVETFITLVSRRKKNQFRMIYNSVKTQSDAKTCLNQTTCGIEKIISSNYFLAKADLSMSD